MYMHYKQPILLFCLFPFFLVGGGDEGREFEQSLNFISFYFIFFDTDFFGEMFVVN